jgi:NitT/TauT family transport system substrate-binding protein
MRYLVVSLLCVSWIFAFVEPSAAQHKKLERVTVSYHTLVPTYSPFWIGKEKGIFEKYGLDVELAYIPSSAIALSALMSGNVQLTTMSGSAAIPAIARGAPVTIVSAFGPTRYKLVANPSINSISDLKGRIIGNSRPGGSIDFAIRRLVNKLRLTPGKDVTVFATGVQESRGRIMLIPQGKIDATLGTIIDVTDLEERGYKFNVLADLSEMGIYGSGAVICVTNAFLASKRQTVRAFLMAFSESIWIGKTRKDVTFAVLRKYLKIEKPALLEAYHKQYLVEQIPQKPYPSEASMLSDIEDLADRVPELKGRSPSDFVNTSILEELERDGWFNRIQR